jgi:hypothetical protein
VNVAPSTAAEGACASCSSPLAAGQRYCIECGERRAELPLPFRPPERGSVVEVRPVAALPGSARRSFGAVGTVVLACGVLIGAAVGPTITPSSLAATAGQLVVVTTDAVGGSASTVASGSGSGSGASATSVGLAAPTGTVAAPPNRVINRGGGAAAPAPAAAATASPTAPVAPTTTTPTSPTAPATPQAPAADPTVSGTVVHLSHDGHGYAVVTKDGQLIALHADKEPKLGDKLTTTVKPLDNGSFKQLKPKVTGHADGAKFHGTVTYADAAAGVYTVSAPGVSLLVHLPPPPPAAQPADPAAPPQTDTAPAPLPAAVPAVGTLTTVEATIKLPVTPDQKPQLEETKRVDGDPASGDLDLEAIVRAPDPAAPPDPTHLIVSADDAGESTTTLSVKIPPKFDVSKISKPGTVITSLVKLESDGSYTLVSAVEDN